MTKSKELTTVATAKITSVTKKTLNARAKTVRGHIDAIGDLAGKAVTRAAAAGAVIAEVGDLLVKAGKGAPMSKKAWLETAGLNEMTANKWKRVHLISTVNPRIAGALPQQIEVLAKVQQAIEKDAKLAGQLEDAIGTDGKIVAEKLPELMPKAKKPDAKLAPTGKGAEAPKPVLLTRATMLTDAELETVAEFLETTKSGDPIAKHILLMRDMIQASGLAWGDEAQMSRFAHGNNPFPLEQLKAA